VPSRESGVWRGGITLARAASLRKHAGVTYAGKAGNRIRRRGQNTLVAVRMGDSRAKMDGSRDG